MIAIDTNIVVRLLVADDPTQTAQVAALVRDHLVLLLTSITLATGLSWFWVMDVIGHAVWDMGSIIGSIFSGQFNAQREAWRELGDERLLQRYARQRALPTLAMGQLTDGLLHLFASEQPMLRELRNRGLSLVNGLPPLKRLLTTLALDA